LTEEQHYLIERKTKLPIFTKFKDIETF